jgi:hypothetical protein
MDTHSSNLRRSLDIALECARIIRDNRNNRNIEIFDVANLYKKLSNCDIIKTYKENTLKVLVVNQTSFMNCNLGRRDDFYRNRSFFLDQNTYIICTASGIEQDDEIICLIAYYLYSKNIPKDNITIYSDDNYMMDAHDNPLGAVSRRTLEILIQYKIYMKASKEEIAALSRIRSITDAANFLVAISLFSAIPDDVSAKSKRADKFKGFYQKYLKYKQKYLELKKQSNSAKNHL